MFDDDDDDDVMCFADHQDQYYIFSFIYTPPLRIYSL